MRHWLTQCQITLAVFPIKGIVFLADAQLQGYEMIIHFSKQQQDDLSAWIGKINWAHFAEECEPPGYDLVISISHVGINSAEARCGSQTLDLGDVDVSNE
jgi:hypothetical protein